MQDIMFLLVNYHFFVVWMMSINLFRLLIIMLDLIVVNDTQNHIV